MRTRVSCCLVIVVIETTLLVLDPILFGAKGICSVLPHFLNFPLCLLFYWVWDHVDFLPFRNLLTNYCIYCTRSKSHVQLLTGHISCRLHQKGCFILCLSRLISFIFMYYTFVSISSMFLVWYTHVLSLSNSEFSWVDLVDFHGNAA